MSRARHRGYSVDVPIPPDRDRDDAAPPADPSVLFVMPHLTFGGAERLASHIVGRLSARSVAVTVAVTTEKPGEADAAEDWFRASCRVVSVAEADMRMPVALLALAEEARATTFVMFGRGPGFHALPSLRRALPASRIASFQFNEHEIVEENSLYASFIDLVVAESEVAARALLDRGVSEHRIAVIPSGPALGPFLALRRPPRGEGHIPTVAFAGRFDAIKGPDLFVDICDRLRDRAVRFSMAGDGPYAPSVAAAIRRHRLGDRIVLHGRLAADALPAFYAGVDVVVVPSTIDGRPLVVQEAQASGCAVVASRVGAIPELVVDGVSGRLCPPGDVEKFVTAVAELLDDAALADRLATTGRRRAARDGGLEASIDGYVEAILGRPAGITRAGATP